MSLAWRALLVFGIFARIQCQEEGEPEDMEEPLAPEEPEDSNMTPLSATRLQGLHAKSDTNGDGKVSLQEIMALGDSVAKAQATIGAKDIGEYTDTDKDGFLSLEEHLNDMNNQDGEGDEEVMKEQEQHKRVETAKFGAADANGDGKLSGDELTALFYPEQSEAVLTIAVAETMRRKDKNNDGKLTFEEFEEHDVDGYSEGVPEMSEEELKEHKDMIAASKAEFQADFARVDTNGDGSVDIKELRAYESGGFHTESAMKKLFEVTDKNSDMHLTSDELVEAREKIVNIDAHLAAHHLLMEWAEHHEL